MGKYIFSGGNIGVWERFRPLIHPLILGLVWKFNLSPILIGKLLDLLFSLCSVYLVYLLGKEIFNRKIGLISSLLFSLTPLFIMFTGIILTEPLAIFLGLIGLYSLIAKRRFFLSGFFIGLSFLTKFPQGIFFGAIFLVLLFKKEKLGRKIRNISTISFGFIVPIIPYFVFNYLTYSNMFEPFISGSWIITTATWLYGSGITYYFAHFFLMNPIYLFFFGYVYLFFKEKLYRNPQHCPVSIESKEKQFKINAQLIIFLISILTIAYFIYVPRKEPRYLVTIIPLLAIMVSYCLVKVYQHLKKVEKPFIRPKAFIIISIILLLVALPEELIFEPSPLFELETLRIIREKGITGPILSSGPQLLSLLDQPIILLNSMEFAPRIYEQSQGKFELLSINDCDLICAPEDTVCLNQKDQFIKQVALENKQILNRDFIFKKSKQKCRFTLYMPKNI